MNDPHAGPQGPRRRPYRSRWRTQRAALLTALAMLAGVLASAASPAAAAECNWDYVDLHGGWGWDEFDEGLDCSPGNNPGDGGTATGGAGCNWDYVDLHGGWGWDEFDEGLDCSPGNNPGDGGTDDGGTATGGAVTPPTQDDIVLVFAGQSNAIANRNTSTDTNGLDGQSQADGKVFVRVPSSNSWQQADLCNQAWGTSGAWPGTPGGSELGSADCGNHPGFHMAAKLAQKTGKKVYLIASGQDGQPLERWIGDERSISSEGSASLNACLGRTANEYDFDSRSGDEVESLKGRIDDLPNGVQVDVFGWIQGEANLASSNNTNYGEDRYRCKLLELARRLNTSNHINFGGGTQFITGHVREYGETTNELNGLKNVNSALRRAASDNGWMRTFTPSANYAALNDGTHFTNDSIRRIGRGMACEFLGSSDNPGC